jgi:hypothetical protein
MTKKELIELLINAESMPCDSRVVIVIEDGTHARQGEIEQIECIKFHGAEPTMALTGKGMYDLRGLDMPKTRKLNEQIV